MSYDAVPRESKNEVSPTVKSWVTIAAAWGAAVITGFFGIYFLYQQSKRADNPVIPPRTETHEREGANSPANSREAGAVPGSASSSESSLPSKSTEKPQNLNQNAAPPNFNTVLILKPKNVASVENSSITASLLSHADDEIRAATIGSRTVTVANREDLKEIERELRYIEELTEITNQTSFTNSVFSAAQQHGARWLLKPTISIEPSVIKRTAYPLAPAGGVKVKCRIYVVDVINRIYKGVAEEYAASPPRACHALGLKERSVHCKYVRALRSGWHTKPTKRKRIRATSPRRSGRFAPRTSR